MNKTIETIRNPRKLLIKLTEGLSEQLKQRYRSFNNNIIWNLGHIITAQRGFAIDAAV